MSCIFAAISRYLSGDCNKRSHSLTSSTITADNYFKRRTSWKKKIRSITAASPVYIYCVLYSQLYGRLRELFFSRESENSLERSNRDLAACTGLLAREIRNSTAILANERVLKARCRTTSSENEKRMLVYIYIYSSFSFAAAAASSSSSCYILILKAPFCTYLNSLILFVARAPHQWWSDASSLHESKIRV